jgi:protein-S-isoprenylcysteine O-methyltransferase Ste14
MSFSIHQIVRWCWLALALVWIVSAVYTKPTIRAQSSTARLLHIALALLGGLIIGGVILPDSWMSRHFIADTPTVEAIGLALTIAGLLFAVWARITLGANWSGRATVKQDHELIVRGPYALARHPIYTGILTALAGTLLIYGQWRSLIGFLVILLALTVKMRQEEGLMMQTFPQDYPEYRRRVKALVPGVF